MTARTTKPYIRLRLGDCFEVLRELDSGSIGSVVTDPPYGLQFMSKSWDAPWKYGFSGHGFSDGADRRPGPSFQSSRNPTCQACGKRERTWKGGPPKCDCDDPQFDSVEHGLSDRQKFQQWCVCWLQECWRVLVPGGIIKVFGAPRMFHRMAAAMEEAGFVLPVEHSLEAWGFGCLSEDTDILTQDGWVPYHRAKIGTRVCGYDPATGCFTWQSVEATFEYPYDQDAYRIYGQGTDQIVSAGHRCIVERDGQWQFITSDDLAETEVVPCLQLRVHAQDGRAENVWAFLCEPDAGLQEKAFVGTEGPNGGLHGLRQDEVVCGCVAAKRDRTAGLLLEMQWCASGTRMGKARAQGSSSGDAGGPCVCRSQDDRLEQSGVERWGDVLQKEGQLHQERPNQVHQVFLGTAVDGSQRRVCHGASTTSRPGNGAGADPTGGGSSRESRPHGQPVGELDVVRLESGSQTIRAARSTRPDLVRAHACVERIHYKGVVWCVKVPTGAFVARRNGMAFITGNSGFPKYLNTSKAIDEHLGKRPTVVGQRTDGRYKYGFSEAARQAQGPMAHEVSQGWVGDPAAITAATTPEAAKFDGWATALKPGWEPFIVGFKPEAD